MDTVGLAEYGFVFIHTGKHKGRIGIYDDHEEGRIQKGIIYFSPPEIYSKYHAIPLSYMSKPKLYQVVQRRDNLINKLVLDYNAKLPQKRIEALEELFLIEGIIKDHIFNLIATKSTMKSKIFLSHSSADKSFVRTFAIDLMDHGYDVWLDEWDISIGDSIPSRISEGIEESNYVAIVLSKSSTESKWVENEWQAKYWDEVSKSKVMVLPILIEDCTIPTLLKIKKYADFRKDYFSSLREFIQAIEKHSST